MFRKIGQSAERVVDQVSLSRRGFIGRAAKLAAGAGATLAGLAAIPTEAQAAPRPCRYVCSDGTKMHYLPDKWHPCPSILINPKTGAVCTILVEG
jgi:hypothetical protein